MQRLHHVAYLEEQDIDRKIVVLMLDVQLDDDEEDHHRNCGKISMGTPRRKRRNIPTVNGWIFATSSKQQEDLR